MQRKTKFLLNGSLIALTSLLLRLTGLGFSAYITLKLGAEGTGLISLVNTVYGFGITVAVSGIYLACMRLCSHAIGTHNAAGLQIAMQKSFIYAAFFGFSAMFTLYTLANFAGTSFLGDERTVASIRVLSFALPSISLATVTDAYFAAVGRVHNSAISDIAEQTFKVVCSMVLLKAALPFGLEACVLAVTKGSCIGEIGSFGISALLYFRDRKKTTFAKNTKQNRDEKLLRIALPIAFSTYARSGLVTIEHALIPKGLQKYGAGKQDALSVYGIVRGMALPIVLFPASVLSAFTGLLIPEFAEDNAANSRQAIDRKASLSMHTSGIFASMTTVILFAFGKELGCAVYKNENAGNYIRCFSVLIPFMYCDTTADSILKGLDKQVYTMVVNIFDAAASVLMTWKVLPKTGIKGYIFTVFMTEILNFTFSAGKLSQIVKLNFQPLQALVFPIAATGVCSFISRQILLSVHVANPILFSIFGIGASLLLSLPLVAQFSFSHEFLTDTVEKIKSALRPSKEKQRNPARNSAAVQ